MVGKVGIDEEGVRSNVEDGVDVYEESDVDVYEESDMIDHISMKEI